MNSYPLKEKYNENRHEYTSYHLQIAKAFQKDCEKLLVAFKAEKTLSFVTFSKIWKQMYFSLVFSGQELAEEIKFFTESCFFIIKKYILFSQNIYIQLGAFYTMYGIYFKQPIKTKISIRWTQDEFSHLLVFLDKMKPIVKDAGIIYNKLKLEDAFKLVVLPRCYALESKYMWQEVIMKNDIFKNARKPNPIQDTRSVLLSQAFYGLNCIYDVSEDYARGLKKYNFSARACESTVNFAETIESLVKEMETSVENTNEEAACSQLKKKCFAAPVNVFREHPPKK